MTRQSQIRFSNDVVVYPLLIVIFMWVAFWLEFRIGGQFRYYGIYPQKIEGLRGILFGPFIHGDLKHLFNNSIPMVVLTSALFFFYREIRWKVLIYGALLTGLLTWLIGRPALHIGASGIVYLLAAFLFFKGVFSRHFQLIALSLVVVFLYGSMLWYLFPIDPKISWEGHLSGFLVGFVFALLFRKNPISKHKYDWEREDYNPDNDPFLKHFDEDGNFIEHLPEEESENENISVNYEYKPDKKAEK